MTPRILLLIVSLGVPIAGGGCVSNRFFRPGDSANTGKPIESITDNPGTTGATHSSGTPGSGGNRGVSPGGAGAASPGGGAGPASSGVTQATAISPTVPAVPTVLPPIPSPTAGPPTVNVPPLPLPTTPATPTAPGGPTQTPGGQPNTGGNSPTQSTSQSPANAGMPAGVGPNATSPHIRNFPTATGAILNLAPNEVPTDRVVMLAREIELSNQANRVLLDRIKQLESVAVTREQALDEAVRDVEDATTEITKTRAELLALRAELTALRVRLQQVEKEDIETLKAVIAVLEKLLLPPGRREIP